VTRLSSRMAAGVACLAVGIVLVLALAPSRGVNGWTLLGVVFGLVGLALVESAADR
jgi:multisubunit Na+/H+ antiporter MnhB subunit